MLNCEYKVNAYLITPQLAAAYRLLPTYYLPTAYLPTAYLPTAYCLLNYCLLTYCLLPTKLLPSLNFHFPIVPSHPD